MARFWTFLLVAALLSLALVKWGVAAGPASSSVDELSGIVKSSAGKPLGGVAVSAQETDKTYTTTVYTDENGKYAFPRLAGGHYQVWAQAVGFEAGRSTLDIASASAGQDFTLKALQDFHKQLSGAEALVSLPVENTEDLRMREVLDHVCTGCHPASYILQNRFDAAGWNKILNFMERTNTVGYIRDFNTPNNTVVFSLVQSYREELSTYLAKVRGPNPIATDFKPFPRPSGSAAQVVITEYALPEGDHPDQYMMDHDGSNWSEGTPSKFGILSEMAHDMAIAPDGTAWFSDHLGPDRTIGKLDPKTGHVTGYKLTGKDGIAMGTHGIVADQKSGMIWATNQSDGTILGFDPKTEKFERFPKPATMTKGIGPTITVDSKGNPWATETNGVFRLNPETGEYTEFKAPTKDGDPYGITVDANDDVWFAELANDHIGVVDVHTGEVSEITLPPLQGSVSEKDREISERSGSTTSSSPVLQKGPRRMAADLHSDTVWVAEYWGNGLARINIHDKKVMEYPIPLPYAHPYAVAVDKNHMVWVNLTNTDQIVKFNPNTKQFTEYLLPSRGTETRFITVNNKTEVPTIWVPYTRVNKLAELQFRTSTAQ